MLLKNKLPNKIKMVKTTITKKIIKVNIDTKVNTNTKKKGKMEIKKHKNQL